MSIAAIPKPHRHASRAGTPSSPGGFSLIELLIGMSIMAFALLSIATMFSTGYTDVTYGGKTTMAAAAARQMLEDIQSLKDIQSVNFATLETLNGKGTAAVGSVPAAEPGRSLVRKWRYALAGDNDAAWGFTSVEKKGWSVLTASGVPLGATGQITVANFGGNATLKVVTVRVSLPGRMPTETFSVQLSTLISRL